jgi:uncharacterized membrane protein (UPF0127 family)
MLLYVTNRTQGTLIADRCELARSFFERGKGLMGRPGLERGQGLLIYPEWSIHTFFMRFAIDVIFLDTQDRVVGFELAMPPNRLYAGVWGARAVLELPAEQIGITKTQVGDQLVFEPPVLSRRA